MLTPANLSDVAGGYHLQAAAAGAVVQPHVGAARHVIQRVPHGDHRLCAHRQLTQLT